MRCRRCEEFYVKHPLQERDDHMVHVLGSGGDDNCSVLSAPIDCAFETGVFSSHNWNCETMNELRDFVDEDAEREGDKTARWWHDDDNMAIVPIPQNMIEDVQRGMLVMGWYKRRGRTGTALVISDDVAEPLTLKTAEYLLEKYNVPRREHEQ
jgi:hypothetical protein